MSKVTDISTMFVNRKISEIGIGNEAAVGVLEDGEDFKIVTLGKGQTYGQIMLTREQAEFVLPHLQRWLTGDRG